MSLKRAFDINRLKPFHREEDRMPKPAPEKADQVFGLDHDLRPDEQAYVNHYIGYADILLNHDAEEGVQPQSQVIELPRMQEPEPTEEPGSDDNEDNGKAA